MGKIPNDLYDEVQEEMKKEKKVDEILNGNSIILDSGQPKIIQLLVDSEYGQIYKEMKNSLDYLNLPQEICLL
jgi:hypothetical protein